jgi:threonine/homoserine/homoserine lactone efflux protein
LPKTYWAFLISSIIIILIPGPSVLFVMSRAIALGNRAAVATAVGNALGTFVNVLVLAVGLGPILENYPVALKIIRYLGAAYLIYLGAGAIRSRNSISLQQDKSTALSTSKIVKEGAFVGLTNPKTIVFFAAVLPQFVVTQFGYIWLQLLLLGLVFCLLGASFDSMYGISAGMLRSWFAHSPDRLSNMSAAGGIMIILLGIAVAIGWF